MFQDCSDSRAVVLSRFLYLWAHNLELTVSHPDNRRIYGLITRLLIHYVQFCPVSRPRQLAEQSMDPKCSDCMFRGDSSNCFLVGSQKSHHQLHLPPKPVTATAVE